MGNSNAQQIEYWNGPAGQRWSQAQDRIAHHLGLITETLMAFAAPRPGERVLDIGCGGGTTALLVRERIGPEGGVSSTVAAAPTVGVAGARAHAGMAARQAAGWPLFMPHEQKRYRTG